MKPERVRLVDDESEIRQMLAGPRIDLLTRLRRPESASSLARATGLPRQRLNYHLRALERAGLVRLVEERTRRNCTERVLQADADRFVVDPEIAGRRAAPVEGGADRFSPARLLDVAIDLVRRACALLSRPRRDARRAACLALDATVRFDDANARNWFVEDLAAAFQRLAAKHGSRTGDAYRFYLCAHPDDPEPGDTHQRR